MVLSLGETLERYEKYLRGQITYEQLHGLDDPAAFCRTRRTADAVQSASMQPQLVTRKCPFCAESIQPEAVRCKHCQADLVGEPPCKQCGGQIVDDKIKYVPGGIVAIGVILIVFGVLGLPFFGLGTIGIIAGIVLLAVVRSERPILRCGSCKNVRPRSLRGTPA